MRKRYGKADDWDQLLMQRRDWSQRCCWRLQCRGWSWWSLQCCHVNFGVVVAEEIASKEEDCGRAVSGSCVDREGRPVSGVHGGYKLGEWGLAKGEVKLVCRGKVLAKKGRFWWGQDTGLWVGNVGRRKMSQLSVGRDTWEREKSGEGERLLLVGRVGAGKWVLWPPAAVGKIEG